MRTAERSPDAPSLAGTSIGAMICAFFGAPWMFWAVAWSGSQSQVWFYALDAIWLAILGIAVLGIRRAFRITRSRPEVVSSSRIRRLYWLNTGASWALVIVAAIWLSRMGRSDLIPQVCGLIVGVHFFPLARIFRAPIYFGTGAAMIVGELVSLMLERGYARNILGCGAVGLALWATAVILLTSIFSVERVES